MVNQKFDLALFAKDSNKLLQTVQLHENFPALKESLAETMSAKSVSSIEPLWWSDTSQILVIATTDSILVVNKFHEARHIEIQKSFLQAAKLGTPKACAAPHLFGVAVLLFCRSSLDYVVCNFKFNKPSYTNFSSYVGSRIIDVRMFEVVVGLTRTSSSW